MTSPYPSQRIGVPARGHPTGPEARHRLARFNVDMLLVDFARDPTGTFERIARERGDLAFFDFGPVREVLVSHPDMVERVLVTEQRAFSKGRALQEARRVVGDGLLTSEGDAHLRQRRLIQPLFHNRTIGAYAEDMVAATEREVAQWPVGGTIDAHEAMMRLTLGIVARTVFDLDVTGRASAVGDALDTVIGVLSNRLTIPYGTVFFRIPTPATRRFDRARALLDDTVAAMIAERRATPSDGLDLLSRLLDAGTGGDRLDDTQVRDEAMTLLLAGHETTAVWLSWTIMLLALHPTWRDRLEEEVGDVLAGRPATPDDLERMPILDRVLREALRLYPPVWLVGRRALRDVDMGEGTIPTGTIVVTSQWVVHHDARWFPQPDRFMPERWDDPSVADLPRFAFFPFGGGVRRCIGEGFAWMEAKLVLATIVTRRRLDLVGHVPRTQPRVTLRPRGGVPVVVGSV